MLTIERWDYILSELRDEGVVNSQTLMEKLGVSESTIRRDLSQLEEDGKLVRIHGGAKLPKTFHKEQSIHEKLTIHKPEKQMIGRYAASLVKDDTFIYIDAGSTTYEMIRHLTAKDITVVTNGMQHAQALSVMGIRVMMLGGYVKQQTQAIIGSQALKHLQHLQFSQVFLGINSIDTECGLTTPDTEEAAVKTLAIERGNRVYVLADASKFNTVSFSVVSTLDVPIIITNKLDQYVRQQYQRLVTLKEVLA